MSSLLVTIIYIALFIIIIDQLMSRQYYGTIHIWTETNNNVILLEEELYCTII